MVFLVIPDRFENLVERRLVNFLVQDLPVFQLFSNNFVRWKKKENIMEILTQSNHSLFGVLLGDCLVLQRYANQADTRRSEF